MTEDQKYEDILDMWFPLFCIAMTGGLLVSALTEEWLWLLFFSAIAVAVLANAIKKVEPVHEAIVLRLGRRICLGEEKIYFYKAKKEKAKVGEEEIEYLEPRRKLTKHEIAARDFNPDAENVEFEVWKKYLVKKDGWRIVLPFFERLVQISLRRQKIEINEPEVIEAGQKPKKLVESFITGEGVHIVPEVIFFYRVVDPNKVFELGGTIVRNEEGDYVSQSLEKAVHDMVLSGSREVLSAGTLETILKRTVTHRGNIVPFGEKIKDDVQGSTNWERLGSELEIVRIEDIRPEDDAVPILQALANTKTAKLEKQKRETNAQADLAVRTTEAEATLAEKRREAEGIKAIAEATLVQAQKQAAGLRANILAFLNKKEDESTTPEDSQSYGAYQVGLKRAESLASNTKIVVIPGDPTSQAASGLASIFDAVKKSVN